MGTMGKTGRKGPLGGGQRENSDGEEDSVASEGNSRTTESEALDDEWGHGTYGEAGDEDLTGYKPTPKDLCICDVYEDWAHTNYGGHLSGDITDDAIWKAQWWYLSVITEQRYDSLGGNMGRQFVRTLIDELWGVQERRWNADHFIVFQKVILQRARHLYGVQAIRRRIRKRLDTWEASHKHMMIKETSHTC